MGILLVQGADRMIQKTSKFTIKLLDLWVEAMKSDPTLKPCQSLSTVAGQEMTVASLEGSLPKTVHDVVDLCEFYFPELPSSDLVKYLIKRRPYILRHLNKMKGIGYSGLWGRLKFDEDGGGYIQ